MDRPAPQDDQPFYEDGCLSFEQLHAKYNGAIFSYILRFVVEQDDAADLTQEVFLNAYRAWPRFDGDLTVAGWLYAIADNCCKNHFR